MEVEPISSQIPKACHMISVSEEARLTEFLLSEGVTVLIPESEIHHRSDGRILLKGWFCVFEGLVSDGAKKYRLIFDRRPGNFRERRLSWAALPLGTQTCRIRLGLDEQR